MINSIFGSERNNNSRMYFHKNIDYYTDLIVRFDFELKNIEEKTLY